jgi:hypothetical protein
MNKKPDNYHGVDLPEARRWMPNLLDIYWWKHMIYGLIEVDVSVARQFIAEHKRRTGEGLSFTGYLVFCLAQAVDEDKLVQAYLKGRKQLVVFDDVDVSITIERKLAGTRAPMVHVIRRANRKTFWDNHDEIRFVQVQPVPSNKGLAPMLRMAMTLPQPLPKLVGALVRAITRSDPASLVAWGGTVGVTSVGMFGRKSGWGIANMPHTLSVTVGGIAQKPAVVDSRIEACEMLSLTVAFDHDVVDGAPAARFVRRLVELIESGHGLAVSDQATYYQVETSRVEMKVDSLA